MGGETSAWGHYVEDYCKGNGVDLGHGGDPITEHALRVDLPKPYTNVGDAPNQWAGDAKDLFWFRDEVLDYVYSSHLLEDFVDTEAVLREWSRVLKPHGRLILNCPDEQRFSKHCKSTGQPYNNAHVHANFSLLFVKDILDRMGYRQYPLLFPSIGAYCWLMVAQRPTMIRPR